MQRLAAADFDGIRLRDPAPYAVLFSADWCPFCRRFLPQFQAIEQTLQARIALADLTDLDNPWWETFEIEVVPSILGFRGGNLVWRVDGVRSVGLGKPDLDKVAALVSDNPGGASP